MVILKSLVPVSAKVLFLSRIVEAEGVVHRFSVGYHRFSVAALFAGTVGASLGPGAQRVTCRGWRAEFCEQGVSCIGRGGEQGSARKVEVVSKRVCAR